MSNNNKKLVLISGILAIILAAAGSVTLFFAILRNYEIDIGHFSADSVFAHITYGILIASVLIATVLAILNRSVTVKHGKAAGPLLSFASAFTAFIMIASVIFDNYQHTFNLEKSYSTLVLLSSALGILSALSLLLFAFVGSYRTSFANILSFAPVIYFITRTLILYFDKAVTINSPVKILVQLAFLSLVLVFIFDAGIYIGKEKLYPKYLSALIMALTINGSVAIASLLATFVNEQIFTLSLADSCMLCSCFVLCAAKLHHAVFALAGEKAERKENGEKPE